jgi:hypothetical protein
MLQISSAKWGQEKAPNAADELKFFTFRGIAAALAELSRAHMERI